MDRRGTGGYEYRMDLLWDDRGRRNSEQENDMSNEGYHEPVGEMSDETRDMHRAIVSLMEELEAVDWYNQRVDACKDDELRRILIHNRDEEKEHAAMVIEWIRRRDPVFEKELKENLFTEGEIGHGHHHD
jgi:ferritin-like protein